MNCNTALNQTRKLEKSATIGGGGNHKCTAIGWLEFNGAFNTI